LCGTMRPMSRPADCELCKELRDGPAGTEFEQTYAGDPPDRLLASSSGYRLIADLAPLTEGHALLLPAAHHLSFANALVEDADEVGALLGRIDTAYSSIWGRLTLLEHGSSTSMLGSACIHHAHLHLLPVDGRAIDAIMSRDGLQHQDLPSLADLAAALGGTDEAYFLRADNTGARVYGIGQPRKSQYLRAVAAEALGLADGAYDWAAITRREAMRNTRVLLAQALDGPPSR